MLRDDKTQLARDEVLDAPPQRSKSMEEEGGHGESGGHGGTEMGWLVSYADMMTLLFGLFVILYSLKQDRTKDMDSILRQVSDQYFGQTGEAGAPAPNELKDLPPTEILKEAVESQKAELEKKSGELEVEFKKLQAERETFANEKKEFEARQAVRDPQSEAPRRDESAKYKKQIEELKARLEEIQKNRSAEAEAQGGNATSKSYLSIMAYWTTKDHDIDLSIETPSKHTYDFKRRKFEGAKGELILDTRRGPGAEIWHGEEAEAGIYKITMNLYSQYSNPEPAVAKGHISTVKGVIELPEMKLDSKTRRKIFRIKLDDEGKLEILP